MSSVRNMTSGPPGRLILTFALPLMLGNLFQQFYTIADAAIVGQVLGVEAIAAVGAGEWFIWMMLGMIQGFTQGFAIQMAHEFGAGNTGRLRNVIFNSAVLSAVCALILLVTGQLAAKAVLDLLYTPETILTDSMTYLRTMFLGIPVMMAYNLFAAILRSLGDGRTPLYAMICACIINIGLDLLFVPVLQMGVSGAAIATVLAQLCSGLFCIVKKFQREDLRLSASLQLRLMKLGAPMAFQNAVISVGGMIVQTVVNRFGLIFIAGFTAGSKLHGVLEIATSSYGFAMTTYTGQNLGAGRMDRIRQGYRNALFIALITSLVIAAVMIFAGKWILLCFINGDPRTTADTLAVAYHYLFIMSVCLPVLYYLHVTRSCIQGLGNTILPMISGVAEFCMRTTAALALPLLMGQNGIFYAEIAAWTGADIVLFFSFLYEMKRKRF